MIIKAGIEGMVDQVVAYMESVPLGSVVLLRPAKSLPKEALVKLADELKRAKKETGIPFLVITDPDMKIEQIPRETLERLLDIEEVEPKDGWRQFRVKQKAR